MKRWILSFVILLTVSRTFAIPAYPRKICIRLNNVDSTYIYLRGDESVKWAETEDGYTLLADSIGWLYATLDEGGATVCSSHRLSVVGKRTPALSYFLSKTPKGLRPELNKSPISYSKKNGPRDFYSPPIVGEQRTLVVLMAFSDKGFLQSNNDFEQLFNGENYTLDGARGSVRDFFNKSSYGQLNLTCEIFGPFIASQQMGFYGQNDYSSQDKNVQALFSEALNKIVSAGVKLSDFDANGDGYVDNFHIVFAGYGEEAGAPSDAIWSHKATFPTITVQGVKINSYSCAPELRGNTGSGISRIGPHCHEMGHALGAMDFYDVDYATGGLYDGTGKWDLMASGSWNEGGIVPADFNPYVKVNNFGWTEAKTLPNGEVEILPSNFHKDQIYILPTVTEGEYYLLENRVLSSYGMALPGEGLLIYHIHENIEKIEKMNRINSTFPQHAYIVCASSTVDRPSSLPSSFGATNTAGTPFPGTSGKNAFSAMSIPAAFCWNGAESNLSLVNITQHSDGRVTLMNKSHYTDNVVWSYKQGFEKTSPTIYNSVGKNAWRRYKISDYSTVGKTEISSYEGDYCMILQSINTHGALNESSFVLTPEFSDEKQSYHFSFAYYNSPVFGENGSLIVYTKSGENEEWEKLDEMLDETEAWTVRNYILPSKPYQLNFTGILSRGILCVDDISIKSKQPLSVLDTEIVDFCVDGNIINIEVVQPTNVYVYDLYGRQCYARHHSAGTARIELPDGIYVVEIGHLTRKVFLR